MIDGGKILNYLLNFLKKLVSRSNSTPTLLKYETFEDWYNEQEGYHLVGELLNSDPNELRLAFKAGRKTNVGS